MVTCANNSSYPVKGVGKVVLNSAHGGSFILSHILYVPGIKKNLISVPAVALGGLDVKFSGHKCTVYDLEDAGTIVASGTLRKGLYRLDHYAASTHDAMAVVSTEERANAELWHARFGHLNFKSLQRLYAHEMVLDMP